MTTNLICNASLFTKGCFSLESDNVHDFTFSFTKLSESLPALSKSGQIFNGRSETTNFPLGQPKSAV